VSTKPSDLGPMLVSVLKGTRGRHGRSVRELADYIVEEVRPQIVSITNSLLSGVAPVLKLRLNAPIVCALQGEDAFVDASGERWASQARRLLQENSRSIDLFLSPSETYAEAMAAYLQVPRERIRVVRAGIDPRPYSGSGKSRPYPFTVGYLSVITPAKGLDILVDAVLSLLSQGKELELNIAGKVLDRKYWRTLANRLESSGRAGHIRFYDELDFAAKVRFLRRCSVLCVPSRIAETRGIVTLEAQAAGVPVVVPDSGIFPEMLRLTGGGVLYERDNAQSLAEAVAALMEDPARLDRIGEAGAEGVRRHFSADQMVEQTLQVLQELTAARSQ